LESFHAHLFKDVEQFFCYSIIGQVKLAMNKEEDMARVFTVNIPYKGKLRAALVSFGVEGYDMSLLVHYLDEDISEVIPGRKVVVSLNEGIKSPKELTKLGEDLLNYTTQAISEYLQIHQQ
jgi:hypothetical protein